MAKKQPGTTLYNTPYVIDKFLAAGGMNSEVYLAHHLQRPNIKYVAKVIYKDDDEEVEKFYERFRKESVTSLRLSEKPNLVHTYEFIHSDDKTEVALIQDFVEGMSLKDYIEKKGFLTPRVALAIFKQVLIGVSGLHNFEHQIIHCDLKPDNIVISKDLSKVTIIDFGISSVITKDREANIKMLASNDGHGTEGYVAPDILNDKITVQYDFFALGIILYKMIMREYPFKFAEGKENPTEDEELARIKKTIEKPLRFDMANISANPTIPIAVENLIFRCIASKPEDLKYRYHDISEIISDVDIIIDQIDHKINNARLIKPLKDRVYDIQDSIVIDRLVKRNKWYQQWWFALVVTISIVILIVVALIVFNVGK